MFEKPIVSSNKIKFTMIGDNELRVLINTGSEVKVKETVYKNLSCPVFSGFW